MYLNVIMYAGWNFGTVNINKIRTRVCEKNRRKTKRVKTMALKKGEQPWKVATTAVAELCYSSCSCSCCNHSVYFSWENFVDVAAIQEYFGASEDIHIPTYEYIYEVVCMPVFISTYMRVYVHMHLCAWKFMCFCGVSAASTQQSVITFGETKQQVACSLRCYLLVCK